MGAAQTAKAATKAELRRARGIVSFKVVIAAVPSSRSEDPPQPVPEPLENGLHLGATEFLRRYEAMPDVKKAELIDGIVYMGSPVRTDKHGEPDNLIQVWLGLYAIETPGVRAAANSTICLGPDDVPQPDCFMRILREHGGRAGLDPGGYLQGAPELVAEIAASSASIDHWEKATAYRRPGVREYLLWRTVDRAVDWWFLEEDEYRPLLSQPDGVFRSRVFPGLWLDATALLAGDSRRVLAKLQEGLRSQEHSAFVSSLENARQQNPDGSQRKN